jgi:hypothetical protein
MRRTMYVAVSLGVASCGAGQDIAAQEISSVCDSTQIFGNPQHTGASCGELAPAGMRIAGTAVVDPDAERAAGDRGFYSVHQGVALTRGSWAYLPKSRGYTGQFSKATKTWSVEARRWRDGVWVKQWETDSPWRAVDTITNTFDITNRYEQLFQPVLANGSLYMPGASGQLIRIDPTTGSIVATVNPLVGTAFSGDPRTVVWSALAEHSGSIYYTVQAVGGFSIPRDSWLVRVNPQNQATLVTWASLTPASLGFGQFLDRQCDQDFGNGANRFPWPPSPTASPPPGDCGGQTPAINAAPAFTSDGKIILTTTESYAIKNAAMIAVDERTLRPQTVYSLRQNFLDDCGVFTQFTESTADNPAEIFRCRLGTTIGVDRTTNHPVSGREFGIMEASPVVLPNGDVCTGSYSGGYNNDVGHLSCFDGTKGDLKATYRYGWETTPAVRTLPGGDFELVIDDSSTTDGTDINGEFAVSRLTPGLALKARTVTANDSGVAANALLDGQAGIDGAGNVYALNGQGVLYRISPSGIVLDRLSLGVSVDALSSESSWGIDDGGNAILYISYAGTMYAIGASDHTIWVPTSVVIPGLGAKGGEQTAPDTLIR